jgi:hypothetical protein
MTLYGQKNTCVLLWDFSSSFKNNRGSQAKSKIRGIYDKHIEDVGFKI